MPEARKRPVIVFRTTAGKQIGFGHLRRCLTLAAELRARGDGANIQFWIHGPAEAAAIPHAAGFTVRALEDGAGAEMRGLLAAVRVDLLIVDAYDVGADALAAWRAQVGALAVIDDLADRFLDADLMLNSSPHAASLPYRTADGCRRLIGPEYALLRRTFRDFPPRETPADVSRVLVTLGGADPHGDTERVVAAARRAVPAGQLDVVIGPLFGDAARVEGMARAEASHVHVHRGLEDLSAMMRSVDLAISGGGQTLFELAACGLPTVALCLADNQRGNLAALAAAPTLATADWQTLEATVAALAADRALRQTMSEAGRRLVDGSGAVRAAEELLKLAYRRTIERHVEA